MKINENLNTFGLNKDEILASTSKGRIVNFNYNSKTIEDIIKIPYTENIDNSSTEGYLEIPVCYNNTYGVRKICFQWGKVLVNNSETKTVNFHKTFVGIYSLQATPQSIVSVGVSKSDNSSFTVRHNSESPSHVFWLAIGQTE